MQETSWVAAFRSCPSSPTQKFTSWLFFQPLLHPVDERVEDNISFPLYLLVNRPQLSLNLGNFAFNVCNVTLCELGKCPGGWEAITSAVGLGFSLVLASVLARWGRGPSNTPGCWTS